MEAKDLSVPIVERLRFIAIYSSNLDEFFRVRVAGLNRLNALGKKKIKKNLDFNPKAILKSIHENVSKQLNEYGIVLEEILENLKHEGIIIHRSSIEENHERALENYFKTQILAFLQPQFIVNNEPPFLRNKELYFGVRLKNKEKFAAAILNIPSDKIPRFFTIEDEKGIHYYFLDDIIKRYLSIVFPNYYIIECSSFKLNRDADLRIDDEFNGDLVSKIEKQIKKRELGEPVRFLYDGSFSEELLDIFRKNYNLDDENLVFGGRYHNLNDFFQIKNTRNKKLEYPPLIPIFNLNIDGYKSIFEAIDNRDQILHFPYQSYDYIQKFFNEASIHPDVKEINVTFYRMAKNSVIGEALISGAKNGKTVNVFMEVKARFDEENNILWAQRMREAGINIKYSMPGLKVHAKVALIRMESKAGRKFYGFFGTGNLNETTAKIYCDHGLLTSHAGMTTELDRVFRFLQGKQKSVSFNHLIVSQFGALKRFINLIDREINYCKEGKRGEIIIKLNNLEEPNLIEKLYEAADAGVNVKVIVRSICCMVPGTAGIEVSRIVDRYLEHARLFYFFNGGESEMYMGSSDWMNRNLHHRIEISFPVYNPDIRDQLLNVLKIQLKDNTKRVLLNSNLENIPVSYPGDANKVNAQMDTYRYIDSIQKSI